MTNILSWNIQCGNGVDGRNDLIRIASVIRGMADVDIICLQEVSRFNPDLDGGRDDDQVAQMAALFPEHQPVFGAAFDRLGDENQPRRQFGNLILSRLPIIQVFNHPLPQPAPEAPCKHMPRQALEVVVGDGDKAFRVTTTHLEYHSAVQRLAQVARLRDIQGEILDNQTYVKDAPRSGPYAAVARPAEGLVCGDFNSAPDDSVYELMRAPINGHDGAHMDAWRFIHGDTPHAPTCGIFDHKQWPEGPHCRDFFFMTGPLLNRVQQITVNEETNASDHQPVLLVLD